MKPSIKISASQPPARLTWILLILPWLLDMLSGTLLLATVLGSSLWGILIFASFMSPQFQDRRLRLLLSRLCLVIGAFWVSLWIWKFFFAAPSTLSGGWMLPLSKSSLVVIHASLLTAGLGMVMMTGLSSLLWLLKNRLVTRSSLKSRKLYALVSKLPSLEALDRLVQASLVWSFTTWGLGLGMASLTILWADISQKGAGASRQLFNFSWLHDTHVVVTALLWILLALGFALKQSSWLKRSKQHWVYTAASILFMALFGGYLMEPAPSELHQPVRWFNQ